MENDALIERLAAYLRLPEGISGERRRRLALLVNEFKPRVRTLSEFADMAGFLLRDGPPELDAKARKLLSSDNRIMLHGLTGELSSLTVWEPGSLETAVRAFAESRGTKLGKVAQPVRAALTGTTASPGIFDVLSVLGRAEVLARLRAVEPATGPHPSSE